MVAQCGSEYRLTNPDWSMAIQALDWPRRVDTHDPKVDRARADSQTNARHKWT